MKGERRGKEKTKFSFPYYTETPPLRVTKIARKVRVKRLNIYEILPNRTLASFKGERSDSNGKSVFNYLYFLFV